MNLVLAFRAFFSSLFNRRVADGIREVLEGRASAKTHAPVEAQPVEAQPKVQPKALPKSTRTRSDALTLLSTLQRESRLVDLISEPLDEYSDAQIGAAAREVLRDSCKTLERLFALAPLADHDEGQTIDIAPGHSPARLRLLGKSQGTRGTIVHRGWIATKCELPAWQGDPADALVVTPTEVEAE